MSVVALLQVVIGLSTGKGVVYVTSSTISYSDFQKCLNFELISPSDWNRCAITSLHLYVVYPSVSVGRLFTPLVFTVLQCLSMNSSFELQSASIGPKCFMFLVISALLILVYVTANS